MVSSNSRAWFLRSNRAGLLPALNASAFFNFPFIPMFNRFKHFLCGTAALLGAIALSEAQVGSPTPAAKPLAATAPSADSLAKPASSLMAPAPAPAKTTDNSPLTLVQA